jgi:hypothetical protein
MATGSSFKVQQFDRLPSDSSDGRVFHYFAMQMIAAGAALQFVTKLIFFIVSLKACVTIFSSFYLNVKRSHAVIGQVLYVRR